MGHTLVTFCLPVLVWHKSYVTWTSWNHCLPIANHQPSFTNSSRGSEKVLYLFEVIWNQRWRTWPLTGLDIIDLLFRSTHVRSPNMSEMFLYGFLRSIVDFQSDSKFKIDALDSDWWRHFLNYSIMESQDLTEVFLYGFGTLLKSVVTFGRDSKSKMATLTQTFFTFVFRRTTAYDITRSVLLVVLKKSCYFEWFEILDDCPDLWSLFQDHCMF